MALELYNSLTRQIETFTPLRPPKVTLYTCGPTVYNYPHIGNYRAYIFGDILKRTLLYAGYDVLHVMNITDIDDKTIRDSQLAGKSLLEFTKFFTNEFYRDRDTLNIVPANIYPKATEYVEKMVALIEMLIEKGFAYKGEDGSVYFSISKDADYGKLSHIERSALEENAGGRLKSDEYEKDNPQDFALWKVWDAADGEVFWNTTLGKGRPGWHIECSAMSMDTLGVTIDIHTGGIDNMFPHHENEIAQSECATGRAFVRYWMHNGWLLVNDKKMSKSAGNFYTLRDLSERGFDPLAYRYFLMQAHYRREINLNWDALSASETALRKLRELVSELPDGGTVDANYKERFQKIIEHDLDTPRALALLHELAKDLHVSSADKRATMLDFDCVFGFKLDLAAEIPESILELAIRRESARAEKDFALSDELRTEIEKAGFGVKDTETGQKVFKL